MECLVNFEMKPSSFYGLPKIHKSEKNLNYMRTKHFTLCRSSLCKRFKTKTNRSLPGMPNSQAKQLIRYYTKTSYEEDEKLPERHNRFSKSCTHGDFRKYLLVSFDVQSLYSNISHRLGEKAINYWLRKCPNDFPARFPKEFILDGINLIITNNTFCFNRKHYRQTKGMAMGTKFAPVYATLVIGYLEEILYDKINVKYGIQLTNEFVKKWKRFLDDCFILWTKSKQ